MRKKWSKVLILIIIALFILISGILIGMAIKGNSIESEKDELVEEPEYRIEKIVISSIIINDNSEEKNTITSDDMKIDDDTLNTYKKIINSSDIQNSIIEKFPNAGPVELESEDNTRILYVIYVCSDNNEQSGIAINKAYITAFSEYMENNHNVSISLLSDAYATTRTVEE